MTAPVLCQHCEAAYRPEDTALGDHVCECEGYAPQEDHLCEYTADGGTQAPPCGAPATVMNPHGASGTDPWFDYDEWFCTKHADPAWLEVARA